LLRIKVIDLCPFSSLQETQPFFTRNLKPETALADHLPHSFAK